MKKVVYLIFLFFSLCIVSGCTGITKTDKIWDYYGEYEFKIPFDKEYSALTWELSVTANYSIEEIKELLIEAGYGATMHNNGDVQTILISAEKNDFTYYFVLFDKTMNWTNGNYSIQSAMRTVRDKQSMENGRTHQNWFLAPIHILDTEESSDIVELYGSFEEVAEFYRATGKSDYEIDEENKTITFYCPLKGHSDFASRVVIMQYIETEIGNYLEIKSGVIFNSQKH